MPESETQLAKTPGPATEPVNALLRAEGVTPLDGAERDAPPGRFDRLPMQMDVMVRVNSLRVKDLLALERGTVVETQHQHSQDVPVRCGGALLVWGEFEMADQKLAVRITRLA